LQDLLRGGEETGRGLPGGGEVEGEEFGQFLGAVVFEEGSAGAAAGGGEAVAGF
jgi:hypothetical protein